MKKLSYFLIFSMAVMLIAASCNPKTTAGGDKPDTTVVPPVVVTPEPQPPVDVKPEPLPSGSVVEKLIAEYKQGEVEQCLYRTATVYKCSRNAPDAGSEVFNVKGDKIGGCYYNSGAVDMICREASECKVIYRIAKNIWGKPGVAWTGGQ